MSEIDIVVRGMRAIQPVKRMIVQTRVGRAMFHVVRPGKPRFACPLCEYVGPFVDIYPYKGMRRHAQCPKCWSGERHRLHYLCFRQLERELGFAKMTVLHIAPDAFFRAFFGQWFKVQHTADLSMPDVDFNVDLTKLPFDDASYDLVYASHVLEHIKDDRKALSEVRRVLRPGGLAILPVPLVSPQTVEYPEPNCFDDSHWRAPGPDYFDRYSEFFSRIEARTSEDFDQKHQLYLYEDRTQFPTTRLPLRRPMPGTKHVDIVPICYV
jgi:predicted SAM-dependent methyltransferase